MSTYYPESEKPLYYVEFNRGDKPNEFTLFKRQFMYSDEELEKMKSKKSFAMIKMCNEGHPWNIFTADFAYDGGMPDKKWICWMVDALNEKAQKELTSSKKSI